MGRSFFMAPNQRTMKITTELIPLFKIILIYVSVGMTYVVVKGGWAKCFKMAYGPIVLLINKVRKPSLQKALCVLGALEIACDQSRNIEFKLIETQIIHKFHCLINAHFQILHPQKIYTV